MKKSNQVSLFLDSAEHFWFFCAMYVFLFFNLIKKHCFRCYTWVMRVSVVLTAGRMTHRDNSNRIQFPDNFVPVGTLTEQRQSLPRAKKITAIQLKSIFFVMSVHFCPRLTFRSWFSSPIPCKMSEWPLHPGIGYGNVSRVPRPMRAWERPQEGLKAMKFWGADFQNGHFFGIERNPTTCQKSVS